MADVNPSIAEATPNVPELRSKFKAKFADSISKGVYDQRDLDRVETDDGYARCFLRTLKSKNNVDKAIDVMNDCFKFRKENDIWALTDDSFPEDITGKNGIYYKGKDKAGHPILYVSTKANTATEEQKPIMKKYIAYKLEQHHRKNPEQMVVALFDMSGAGTGSLQIDITKYFITCFSTYFPGYLAYMLNYEMPMLLGATWSVISAFLSSDQNKKTVKTNKKDIRKYIDEDQITWEHMK